MNLSLEHLGIILGVIGALLQAANYAFAKDCSEKYCLHGVKQVMAVHLFMFFIMLAPFIYFRHYEYFSLKIAGYAALMNIPYILGQYFTLKALEMSDASMVSPLLTIKIPVLALITGVFFHNNFNAFQIFSILVILTLGCFISSLSGRIKLGPLLVIIVASFFYCLSDIFITVFMEVVEGSRPHRIISSICYEYVGCAVFALPLLLFKRFRISPINIWQGKWVGSAWLGSMFTMISCFNLAGVVEGNIIQSLRGVIGIFIAYIFYKNYIKESNTFKRKLFAGVGMFAAVCLYFV